jgi:hypothetical protein
VLRLTWVRDQPAQVLEHCKADQRFGMWTAWPAPITAQIGHSFKRSY